MKRSASLTNDMSPKTIIGWMASAFIVWWAIEQPANAAHLAHKIGAFFSSAAAGLSAFFASIPTSMIIIPVLVMASVVALVVALIVIRRLTQSARRREDSPTATSLLGGFSRFSALLAGRRRPHTREEQQGEISSTDTSGRRYAGAMGDGDGARAGWSAAWGVVVALVGGFAATLWNSVATTGPRLLIWPACALSLVALAGLYMCFALLGGWWPARLLSPAALAPIARKYPEEESGLASPDPAELLPSFSDSSGRATMSSRAVVGNIP